MDEIMVVYWTGTGNTQTMAEYVAEGIREGGKTPKVIPVEEANADDLKDAAVFALGCPSMGVEVLEESVMEPFVDEVTGFASGKKIGLFGSYGWGDGTGQTRCRQQERMSTEEKMQYARKLRTKMLRMI